MFGSLVIIPFTITAESDDERILKISQHLLKLWKCAECPVLTHGVVFLPVPGRGLHGVTKRSPSPPVPAQFIPNQIPTPLNFIEIFPNPPRSRNHCPQPRVDSSIQPHPNPAFTHVRL